MQTYYEKVLNRMRRPVLLVAVAIVALLSASGVAVAVNSLASGGAIEQVSVAGSSDKFTTTAERYVDIPGATTTVLVSAGETDLLLARYSAESRCLGGGQDCGMRLMAVQGGTTREMLPATSFDFSFHSNSDDAIESHSMDRSLRVGPGTWTVKAQALVDNGSSFTLDDWSLTVERAD